MFPSQLKKILLLAGAVILAASICAAQTIGSPNTVTADPPVVRPSTTPCVVHLFDAVAFADFSPKPFTFTPPADCPGPWAKVVLEADFSINNGRQFDRTANIWIGGANVYFGTTAEPSHDVSRSWHVERDLTDYSSLLSTSQSGLVILGNLVNSTFTSILMGSADLEFYPVAPHQSAPVTADQVLPLSAGPDGGTVSLQTSASQLSGTFSLPMNIERAFLDVVAQSQSNDEFWYSCVPNDVAAELQNCGGSGFRETEVSIDGQPAGVAPVYPWIYTGGIDPLLWRPIPGVQTLNFVPYRVDLSPFAGILSNGVQHTIALSVFNANFSFSTTANLLLYLDHGAGRTFGGVTVNTLTAAPTPNVQENIATDSSGNITGSVNVTSARQYTINGWVQTSHGRVNTTESVGINFVNDQQFDITASLFGQNLQQKTTIAAATTRAGGGVNETSVQKFDWPLNFNFAFVANPDGTFAQTTTIDQEDNESKLVTDHGRTAFLSTLSNIVTPRDTLLFDANFNVTGGQNQSNAQRYFTRDSTGYCYSRQLTAASGVLTSVTDGVGCK